MTRTPVFPDDELDRAFEILLGKAFSEPDSDSTYAVFEVGDSDLGNFDCLYLLTPQNLTADRAADEVNDPINEQAHHRVDHVYDLAGSVIAFRKTGEHDDDHALFDKLKAASLPCHSHDVAVLTGRMLAALGTSVIDLSEYIDCAGFGHGGITVRVLPRVVSDGSLRDAMIAATLVANSGAPMSYDDLYIEGLEDPPGEEWAREMNEGVSPELRDHMYALAPSQDFGDEDDEYPECTRRFALSEYSWSELTALDLEMTTDETAPEMSQHSTGRRTVFADLEWPVVANWFLENEAGVNSTMVVRIPPRTDP